jgi:hypothetical protein
VHGNQSIRLEHVAFPLLWRKVCELVSVSIKRQTYKSLDASTSLVAYQYTVDYLTLAKSFSLLQEWFRNPDLIGQFVEVFQVITVCEERLV